jgi:hypothetical protein
LRADELPHAEQLVVLALDEFQRKHLLDSHPGLSSAPPAISRRALLRRGVTAALLPVVTSIVAPTPLQAQSPGARSRTFAFTGAPETFIVPTGVTALSVSAFGGQGHGFSPATTGLGGSVTATLTVVPGETLIIVVGGAAERFRLLGRPGFNGGGHGGGNLAHGGDGGGASDVRRGGSALGNRVIVAGGGGGAGLGPTPASGGAGGGTLGGPGAPAPPAGGGGGTQTAGGAGGTAVAVGCPPTSGTAGSLGLGGNGSGDCFLSTAGGGGGGGYYGGGGGASSSGGGGGSSFADPSATGVVHVQGTRAGDGLVILTW